MYVGEQPFREDTACLFHVGKVPFLFDFESHKRVVALCWELRHLQSVLVHVAKYVMEGTSTVDK